MRKVLLPVLFILVPAASLLAQSGTDAPGVSAGDTAWVLASAALVMLMTPGLAFFYGGLVRKKSVLNVLMQCLIALALLSVLWVLVGFSLAFSPGNAFVGGLEWAGLTGVGAGPSPYAPHIPALVYVIFQMMFAVITPALIAGAVVERMRFSAYVAFIIAWSVVVYYPVCHWVWGKGGWLANLGILDFAGGIVVHISAGFAAIVTAVYVGRRKKSGHAPTPHNMPFTVLGAALLWFGWFGFNAGSALGANALSAAAFLATNTSAATAAIVWAILDRVMSGRPTVLGTVTGAVAGLATITPASGYVDIWGAMAIGCLSALVCYTIVSLVKPRLKYDDTLDAFGVHGVGGLLGTLLAGVFAVPTFSGAAGLIAGNARQLGVQAIGAAAAIGYTVVGTLVVIKVIDLIMKVRVSDNNEVVGLDLTEHNERAYTLVD